ERRHIGRVDGTDQVAVGVVDGDLRDLVGLLDGRAPGGLGGRGRALCRLGDVTGSGDLRGCRLLRRAQVRGRVRGRRRDVGVRGLGVVVGHGRLLFLGDLLAVVGGGGGLRQRRENLLQGFDGTSDRGLVRGGQDPARLTYLRERLDRVERGRVKPCE